MKKILLILSIMLSLNVHSQNGWRQVFNARWFISSDCADSMNCMGLTYSSFRPRLYFTGDAGLTWGQIFSDSIIYDDSEERMGVKVPRCISYSRTKLALVGCDSGHVLRTTDNGNTWSRSNVGKKVTISKIIMKNDQEGIAFDNLYLHKTNDGGLSWHEILFPTKEYNRKFEDFAYVDGRIFIYFALRYDNNMHLWYSDDDGENWFETNYLTRNGGWIYATDKSKIYVLNRKLDIATNKWFDYILYTSDTGKSWIVQLDTIIEPSSFTLTFIRFYNKNFGIVCGNNGEIHRTTNGGLNWFQDRCSINDKDLVISSASFLSEDKILVFTENGKVFKFEKNTIDVLNDTSKFFFSISPNPAWEYIEIYGLNKGLQPLVPEQEIKIYNLLGECVLSAVGAGGTHPLIPSQEGNIRIDVSRLPVGVYFVRVGNWMGRFVKI